MNVLFLTLYPALAASPRVRVTQYVPALEQHGIRCTVRSALTEDEYRASLGGRLSNRRYHWLEYKRRCIQMKDAGEFDAVVLQKAITTAYFREMDTVLRRNARKLVLDIDDAVHLRPPVELPWYASMLTDPNQVRRLVGKADLVLAGNRWLADEVVEAGGTTEIFPTVVDTDRYLPKRRNDGPLVVGWMGNASTSVQLNSIREPLTQLKDAEIRLVGAESDAVSGIGRCIPWTPETELDHLHAFSVGIMPLEKSEWTRGKCAYKALQYMACGVPCVATPFGAVTDIIRHNENGMFADSDQEWSAAFEQLRDPDERKRLGDAGRATVEAEYSLKALAPKYIEVLERLA